MTITSLRRIGLLAALLLAAILLPGRASAGDGFPGAPASGHAPGPFGGFGCTYTCGYDGRGDGCRCYEGRREPWPPFSIPAPTPYNAAMRDYWDNSEAFRTARRQFKEDNDTYRTQADWYADCMAGGGHCRQPGPPH